MSLMSLFKKQICGLKMRFHHNFYKCLAKLKVVPGGCRQVDYGIKKHFQDQTNMLV